MYIYYVFEIGYYTGINLCHYEIFEGAQELIQPSVLTPPNVIILPFFLQTFYMITVVTRLAIRKFTLSLLSHSTSFVAESVIDYEVIPA